MFIGKQIGKRASVIRNRINIMQCFHCQGDLQSGTTHYVVNRKGYHLIIDEVPALICQQCQQPVFTEGAVELVQNMIRLLDLEQKNRTFAYPG